MINEQKPQHPNGLTKCKRHVITNQGEQCQTQYHHHHRRRHSRHHQLTSMYFRTVRYANETPNKLLHAKK